MRRSSHWTVSLIVLSLLTSALLSGAEVRAADIAVVRGILFYSPTCPHCHEVMTNVLPPLRDQYGEQLVIAEIDGTTAQGAPLWQAAVTRYNPPVVGYPTLIVGDHVLIGSLQIPEHLPGLIEAYLAEGGVPWPDLPGVENVVGSLEPSTDPEALGFWARLRQTYTRDLAGNILSTIVLLGLLVALAAIVQPRSWQAVLSKKMGAWGMLVPLAVGLVAAIYLAYVETTGNEAVCGPVGDCNAVQQSEFALLFGFLPVAVLGVLGYLAIFVAYVASVSFQGKAASFAKALAFGMSVFGLLFSIWLTFLEPFVIGATCAWCLTSAVCMALVAVVSAGPGWDALRTVGRELGVVEASS
ncbi:MAG: vitamin K epoxide reductase [Anaerolineae bacterium]|nr:vitamin K epoxide reductase [Anaerolineae bacterium]